MNKWTNATNAQSAFFKNTKIALSGLSLTDKADYSCYTVIRALSNPLTPTTPLPYPPPPLLYDIFFSLATSPLSKVIFSSRSFAFRSRCAKFRDFLRFWEIDWLLKTDILISRRLTRVSFVSWHLLGTLILICHVQLSIVCGMTPFFPNRPSY